MEEIYDYIIVGAGGAGAVLANRLSENSNVSVLLVERGGSGRHPMLHIPKGFFFTLGNEKLTYQYHTQPFYKEFSEVWQRGRGLGGTTAVNGMMYVRGYQTDYDLLAKRTHERWGWDNFLRAFRAMEDHQSGISDLRGVGGPLGVSIQDADSPTADLVFEAAEKVGMTHVHDLNEKEQEQMGFSPGTIKNGVRQSTANAFLRPIRGRKNLTILTETGVDKVRMDGRRVVGVRARHQDRQIEFTARKEVILAAGTVETPGILERSGIGRGDVLKAAGIDQVVDSPNVGEKLVEQHGVNMQVRLKRDAGRMLELSTPLKQAFQGARYLATRKGPVGTAGYDLMGQFKSRPEVDRPDTQAVVIPFGLDFTHGMNPAQHPAIFLMAYQIHPETQGSIHITDWSPNTPPTINARYFETDEDRAVTGASLNRFREMLAQEPIASEILDEEWPGSAVSSPDEVLKYAMSPGATIYHGVGTATMGNADDDVVDPDLRVRGVEGLRVCDISVLPVQIAGNTAGTAMGLGWLAADLLREQN